VTLSARIAALTALIVVCSAHVGSPDAWYEGNAGPYHVIVQVVTPGVVPGVAKVFARVAGSGVEQVTVQANRFDALTAAPPPEIAEPVAGDAGMYSAPLWIMTGGSNSVTVDVRGALGSGKAVIPVVVVANRRLELDPKLGAVLVVIGVFLFVGLVTIIGAAVRESTLAPGEAPDAGRRWKARTAMAMATALFALALFGGSRWWNLEDSRFNDSIYKPLTSSATIESNAGGKVLDLRISDSLWTMRNDSAWLGMHRGSKWTPLIPDHGKLIHVFMIREPDLLAFAHLHPSTSDSVSFRSALPPLPAGRYRVYGDIVHESGFNETLATRVDLREPITGGQSTTDPDDASRYSTAPPSDTKAVLEDGSIMTLDHGGAKFVEGKDAALRLSVVGANGKPVSLEPYIGMTGHAVVTRDDGAVFIHLHPSGTISMASQMAITMRQPGDTIAGRLGQRINASEGMQPVVSIPANGVISFPYAFPKPGNYHMWVQVRHAGRILTGAFAFTVEPAST
jgi:hypothetical protein